MKLKYSVVTSGTETHTKSTGTTRLEETAEHDREVQ